LCDEDYSGIREIVEELYPDRAHFIYELLQNAEDAGATEAAFTLENNSVSFEHVGRPFSKDDVWGITNIGKGTKRDEEDKIGRFGVGFKAVFAYSEAPHIWSPTFSFSISDLVLPTAINSRPDLGKNTRFEFPFNNPKKKSQVAYAEIEAGLEELAETTLLFLSHLRSIRWQIDQTPSREILRIQHSDNHIEIVKKTGNKTTSSSHFLRFSRSVEGLEKQYVSVAFALDYLPDTTAYEHKKPLARQFKIVPASPGLVAVSFPAGKETSGLRFHLHAPFVPELSRASIKDTPANEPLFTQLAGLSANSLRTVHELGLLTVEFLGALPNPVDSIALRYQPIRKAIIEELNNHPLTPTHSKSHAPAKQLFQARVLLKDLLSSKDIEFLADGDGQNLSWAAAAPQKNSNADRFLSGLAIAEWDVDKFIEVLIEKASCKPRFVKHGFVDEPDSQFMTWLNAKPADWLQQMYAVLYNDIQAKSEYQQQQSISELKQLQIVRLADGKHSIGPKCYFPTDAVAHDEVLPRVDKNIYSSGKSKVQQEQARKFLEEIDVREVGEAEVIEAVLDTRYAKGSLRPASEDLERFINFLEANPERSGMFAEHCIFRRADDKWGRPNQVYVDSPFVETGLNAYYERLGANAEQVALADSYLQVSVPQDKLIKFACQVGVLDRLTIKHVSCRTNPAVQQLMWSALGRWSEGYGIDRDYTITGLSGLLPVNDEGLSRLLWRTACEQKGIAWLRAQYRNNSSYAVREADSQLVCMLRDSSWVAQTDGRFVLPSEASRQLLPKGFPYDEGYEWLKAVRFGEQERQRNEEQKQKETAAKELGFSDPETFERAKQFAALPPADQERILAEFCRKQDLELPEHESRHPERRAERVAQQAGDAPDRTTEDRTRSVPVGLESIKQQAAEYLREQYTNDGEMICQICRAVLPFRLEDGSYYFERVEFLEGLKKRYFQNYLALCPNHSAMFQHANGSRDLKKMFEEMRGQRLEILLAQADATIYFTKTHVADLRQIVEVDRTAVESDDHD